MRVLSCAMLAVALLSLPLSLGCRPGGPGVVDPADATPYIVTGTLTDNACAPGLDPIDPLVFAVRLRVDGGIPYWRLGDGPWLPGTLDRDGTFRFTTRTDVEVYPPRRGTDPELDPGTPGCSVTQREVITGRFVTPSGDAGPGDGGSVDAALVDAGVADEAGLSDAAAQALDAALSGADAGASRLPGGFTAEHEITLTPTPGSDCRAALSLEGGVFPTLPCAARYALDAVEAD